MLRAEELKTHMKLRSVPIEEDKSLRNVWGVVVHDKGKECTKKRGGEGERKIQLIGLYFQKAE